MGAGFAAVVLAIVWVLGRRLATPWLIDRYRAGAITLATFRRFLIAVFIAPWLVLLAILLVIEPSSWWLILLVFILSWPMIVLPVVAIYHEAKRHSLSD